VTLEILRQRIAFRGGTLLLRRGFWRPAAFLLGRATRIAPDHRDAQHNLTIALLKLGRWQDAAGAAKRAIGLDPGAAESHDLLGIAMLHLERWDEAVSACQAALRIEAGNYATHHRLGMALLRLSRLDAAAAALRRAVELAGDDPAAASEIAGMRTRLSDVTSRSEPEAPSAPPAPPEAGGLGQQQAAFWTVENLGPGVFAAERWLEELTAVPEPPPPGARLLFVLDNDFGELTTVKYFLLGQSLAARTTLLLPERLYGHNREAVPGRTRRYGSMADILDVVDREQPAIVFLCSGYLLCEHLSWPPGDLAHLVNGLRERGCRVVTSDPYLGMLSQRDPRTLISFQLPGEQAIKFLIEQHGATVSNRPEIVERMAESRKAAEEKVWAYLGQSEQVLRDSYHLYPSYCDVAPGDAAETDARNLAFFNERLLWPAPSPRPGPARPHWLFILASTDYDLQRVFEGIAGFVDIVANKLTETVAAGRHPILIGPGELIDRVVARLPSAEGIDLLAHCPFTRFMSLLITAEHAFYWNAVSHSLLIRLYNRLPIVLFDRGHLIRIAPAVHRRIVAWYYQGWEPPVRNQHDLLTVQKVEGWAADYRRQADRLAERYRRAPGPEQMIVDLMNRTPPRTPRRPVPSSTLR
jgi:Flp pilus assembly protein TadD